MNLLEKGMENCSSFLAGRKTGLLDRDINRLEENLSQIVSESSFLVIGGAGSIGRSTVKEIVARVPQKMHVVDINENELTEVVRDCRSSFNLEKTQLKVFCISASSDSFEKLVKREGPYDYILNLSALKHVRSEEDAFTLLNMIKTNVVLNRRCAELASKIPNCKYFCVSTDKAANPFNSMGATKKLMELAVSDFGSNMKISSARFANVLFSNGSLSASFNKRIELNQPLVFPKDIQRYFITLKESGQLCLLASILGKNSEIFFPKTEGSLILTSFETIVERFLHYKRLKPLFFEEEEKARQACDQTDLRIEYPVLVTRPNTTGEKLFEEFYLASDNVDLTSMDTLGIIKDGLISSQFKYDIFLEELHRIQAKPYLNRSDLIELLKQFVPSFTHLDTGNFLSGRM